MKIKRSHLYAAAGVAVGIVAIWWLRRPSSGGPPVAGTITSGSQSATIDTNVLSPNFGLPIVVN